MVSNFANCSICKSNNIESLVQSKRLSLYFCKECSFVFKRVGHDKNIDSQLATYNIDNYVYRKQNNRFFIRTAKDRISILSRYINFCGNKLNILEVGCNSGEFLYLLKKMGHDVTGIELSEYACKLANELFDLNIFNGTLEKFCANNTKRYDLITMWHVIEHVEDPANFLNNLMCLLNNNGTLAFSTPNIEGADINFFKYESSVYLMDDHISLFRIACIKNLIRLYYKNFSSVIFTIEPIQSFWFSIINYFIFKIKTPEKQDNNDRIRNVIYRKNNNYLRKLKNIYDKIKLPFVLTYLTFPFLILRKRYLEKIDKGHELYCIITKK